MDWRTVAQRIRTREKEHLKLLAAVLRADEGKIFQADLIVIGAVQRSLILLKGFLAMLRSGNYLCERASGVRLE